MVALGAAADVTWLETSHDFGVFSEEAGTVSHSFRFVNTSVEPVAVLSARTSCGCTASKYSHNPVMPGDTSSIELTYDAAGRPGSFSKFATVVLSDGSATPKLYVKGVVIGSPETVARRFPIECGGAISLGRSPLMAGELTKGHIRTCYLEAYNHSADTIAPLIADMPPHITATAAPAVVPPGSQFTFLVYYDSGRTPAYGLVCDTISVLSSADAPAACRLPVSAFINEDFSNLSEKQREKAPHVAVADVSLDFGKLATAAASRTTSIKNTGKTPLKIRRVYASDSGVSVSLNANTLKHGASAALTVTVDPAALAEPVLNARITLITNDPDKPVMTIRAVGEL